MTKKFRINYFVQHVLGVDSWYEEWNTGMEFNKESRKRFFTNVVIII